MLKRLLIPLLVAVGFVGATTGCRAHAHVKAGPVAVGAGAGAGHR